MKRTKFVIIGILMTIFGLIKSIEIPEESVLVLGQHNFDKTINQQKYVLVQFYAPGCKDCEELASEYAKAAHNLKNYHIYLAKIDAIEHIEIANRYNVEKYPTLKFFSNGGSLDYEGGRTEQEIFSWIMKMTTPSIKTLNHATEIEAYNQVYDLVAVYFGSNKDEFEIFQRIARGYDTIFFATCSTYICYADFRARVGSVVLFKKFDEKRNDLIDGFNEETLKNFIDYNSTPLVMKIDHFSVQLIFRKSNPALILYRDKNSKNAPALDKIITTIANKVRGKIKIVISDLKDEFEIQIAYYVGIVAENLPCVRIYDTRGNDLKKYSMKGDINEDNILRFINNWENDALNELTSQEIPEKQLENVYVLVGKSFNTVVLDSTKDVLVEFYSPLSEECKILAPVYEELAAKLKHNINLVISKIDVTENEVNFPLEKEFPRIVFFPANKKDSPIDFKEEKTVEAFTQFLKRHANHPITDTKVDL